MPVTVQEQDIISKAAASVNINGFQHRRGFRVDGLTSDSGIFYQAYQGLAGVGVAYGLPHPKITGLYVNNIDFTPFKDHKTSVFAVADYGTPQLNRRQPPPGGSIIRVSSSNSIVERAYGGDGKMFLCTWGDPNSTANVTPIVKQNFQVKDENSATCIEIIRQETSSPVPKSRAYRNRVNSRAIWGFGAHELVCRAIDGEQIGGGNGWTNSYKFEGGLAPDGKRSMWEQLYVYINKDNGLPPDGIDITDGTNNGYAYVMPKGEIDFGTLALPDPTI